MYFKCNIFLRNAKYVWMVSFFPNVKGIGRPFESSPHKEFVEFISHEKDYNIL